MKLILILSAMLLAALIAAYVYRRKSMEKIFALPPDELLVIDVRSKKEFDAGHLSTAINIPHDAIASQLGRLEPYKRKHIVLYCHSGNRSAFALNVLKKNGFENVVNAGGYEAVKRFDKK